MSKPSPKRARKMSSETRDAAVQTGNDLLPFILPPFGFKFVTKDCQTDFDVVMQVPVDEPVSEKPRKQKKSKPVQEETAPVVAEAIVEPVSAQEELSPKVTKPKKAKKPSVESAPLPVAEIAAAPVEEAPVVKNPRAKKASPVVPAVPISEPESSEDVPMAPVAVVPVEEAPVAKKPRAKKTASPVVPVADPASTEEAPVAPVKERKQKKPKVISSDEMQISASEPEHVQEAIVSPVKKAKKVKKPVVVEAVAPEVTPVVEEQAAPQKVSRKRVLSSSSSDDFEVSPVKVANKSIPASSSSDSDEGEVGWVAVAAKTKAVKAPRTSLSGSTAPSTPAAASQVTAESEASDNDNDKKKIRFTGPVISVPDVDADDINSVTTALKAVFPKGTPKDMVKHVEFDASNKRILVSLKKVKTLADFKFPAIEVNGDEKEVLPLDEKERKKAIKLFKLSINH